MYLMKHRIAVYAKNDLNNNIDGMPFTFHFDESTNQQVKKQYDGYVIFYSTIEKSIVTAYCGTLFVGRCSSPDLLNHFDKCFEENHLNVKLLLNLGMGGPNFNLAFKNLLIDALKENHKTTFIYLGICALHTANNAFGKLLKKLSEIVDLGQIAIDFHFFFKCSAGRREDFQDISNVTGVLTQHLEKHCSSRWISLEKVLVKLIEQFPNLVEYFLKTLPQLPGFNGKYGISSTARCTRIKTYLTDPKVLILMHFVASVAQDFQKFLKPLQKLDPMIYLLHLKCMELTQDLLVRFMKPETLFKPYQKFIGVSELVELSLTRSSNQKVIIVVCPEYLSP